MSQQIWQIDVFTYGMANQQKLTKLAKYLELSISGYYIPSQLMGSLEYLY